MFIKSKLTSGANVTVYAPLREGQTAHQIIASVFIKGGANVQDKKTFVAPDGIIQEIPDSEWEKIKDHGWVKAQIDGGFIIPYGKNKPKEKFGDMADKDKSAQLTEGDYKKRGKKPPKPVKDDDDDDSDL